MRVVTSRRGRAATGVMVLSLLVGVGGCTTAPSTTTTTPPPASSVPGCALKPSASTTGATGSRSNSSVTTLTTGRVLSNANVGGKLVISGDNVRVHNVHVNGSILVTGDGAVIEHVTTTGVSISSAQNTTVQYADIGFGKGDGIHVTSDRGRLVRGVTLKYNWVHDPRVPDNAHYDGIQVRGVDGMSIVCSVFDAGSYQHMDNAGIYLEDANGGDSNIVVARNWIYGSGFSVMMDATKVTLDSNRVGGDIHWGTCRLGKRSGNTNLRSTGNVRDATGATLALCQDS